MGGYPEKNSTKVFVRKYIYFKINARQMITGQQGLLKQLHVTLSLIMPHHFALIPAPL